MSRYVMDIEVTGNAESKLDKLSSGIGKVASQAGQMDSAFKKGAENLNNIDKGQAFDRLGEKVDALANKWEATTRMMVDKSMEWAKQIVSDAALFEDSQSEMRFAFGKDWESVFAQVKKDSADLTFTFQQTAQLAASMGRMKINPFGGALESQQQFMSKNGQTVRALAILQDTADSVGKSADDVIVSVRNALSGSWKSLQDRFDIPKDKIAQWKKSVDGLATPQEKYNKLVAELGLTFGGAGFEKAENWNKNIAQIPDLLQQVRAAVGMEGLKLMTGAVKELVTALGGLLKSKDAMSALSSGFMLVAQAFSIGTRFVAGFVRWLQTILEIAPWLPKVAVGIGLMTIAASAFLAVTLAVGAALTAVVTAFAAIGWSTILTVGATMLALAPLVAGVTVVLAALGLTGKVAADALGEKWGGSGGVFSLFEKGKLLFEAFGEVISTFNGTTSTLSMETAEKLKKAGLLEFVGSGFLLMKKLNFAWEEFTDTMDELYQKVGPVIIPMFEELSDLFYEVADQLGILDSVTQANNMGMDEFGETGRSAALVLGDIAHFTTQVIRTFIFLARVGVMALSPIITTVKLLGAAVMAVVRAVEWLADKLGILGAVSNAVEKAGSKLSLAKGSSGGKLIRDEAVLEKNELRGLERATRREVDFGLGAEFNMMGAKEKQAAIRNMVDSQQISAEDGSRMMKGRAMKPKALKGARFDGEYQSAPYSVSSPAPEMPNKSVEQGSLYTEPSFSSSSGGGGMSNEQLFSSIEKLASRPISIQVDGAEIAKAQQNMSVAVEGR